MIQNLKSLWRISFTRRVLIRQILRKITSDDLSVSEKYKCFVCLSDITNYVTRSKRQPLVDFRTSLEQKHLYQQKPRKKNWNQSRRYYSKGFFNWMTESILKLKSFIYKLKTASWNKKNRYESTNQIRHDNSSIKDKQSKIQ